MIISSFTWLKWAAYFMPSGRTEWLAAMRSELIEINDQKEQQRFAFGCFRASLSEWPKSRRGLSQLTRISGASLLTIISLLGIYQSSFVLNHGDTAALSKIILGMCCIYIVAAIFLLVSLKNLKAFSCAGAVIGALAWIYCQQFSVGTEALPQRFLTAVTFEATGMMGSLFLASVFLGWLYDPEVQQAH